MTLTIPRWPGRLVLPIERLWDGTPCADSRRHGRVELGALAEGLELAASGSLASPPRIPVAPPGSRVAGLWEYDVVECFLAGGSGEYLEVELGPGGHFLVLSFSAPRVRRDEHRGLQLPVELEHSDDRWRARIVLDWALVPSPLAALNAFAILDATHLAFAPLPGPAPDFHQPARFPAVRLSLEEPTSRTTNPRVGRQDVAPGRR